MDERGPVLGRRCILSVRGGTEGAGIRSGRPPDRVTNLNRVSLSLYLYLYENAIDSNISRRRSSENTIRFLV